MKSHHSVWRRSHRTPESGWRLFQGGPDEPRTRTRGGAQRGKSGLGVSIFATGVAVPRGPLGFRLRARGHALKASAVLTSGRSKAPFSKELAASAANFEATRSDCQKTSDRLAGIQRNNVFWGTGRCLTKARSYFSRETALDFDWSAFKPTNG